MTYPLPSPDAIAHSEQLRAEIVKTIIEAGGAIPFSEFMQLALYAPGLGYYSAGSHQFGTAGDFVTAPEISPLFSSCLARQCQQVLAHVENGIILEFGAGSGLMAADILKELATLNSLPREYLILEVSSHLQQRQRATLQQYLPETVMARIRWITQLPSNPISGIILANEVLDAMPVHRFQLEDEILECYVGYQEENFVWQLKPTQNHLLLNNLRELHKILPKGYLSEINLMIPGWIASLADSLSRGLILLIDYGFPQREYYHPHRDQGTLVCHYRHYVHHDPLILVGLQDITAHVNFTDVAQAAVESGLKVAGYTNQANFLLASGLMDSLAAFEKYDTKEYWQATQQVKTLLLPSEMGELFKVIALTQKLEIPLLGFVQNECGKL